jgi:RNA polymerase sigma-70 factor (ECF subfamily)
MYAPLVMTVCRRYAPDQAGAEDILQDAFVKLFRTIHSYDDQKGAIDAWIRKITVNTAIEHWRKWRKQWQILSDAHFPESAAEADSNLYWDEEALLQLIADLPPGFRIVFNLFAIEGYSHQEIAQALNITESASRSQLARARKWLQEALARQINALADEKL